MSGLGRTVVLAGPNGGGKSRLLRLLERLGTKSLHSGARDSIHKELLNISEQQKMYDAELRRESVASPDSRSLEMLRGKLHDFERRTAELNRQLDASDALKIVGRRPPSLIRFVPTVASLQDPSAFTQMDASNRAKQLEGQVAGAEFTAPAYAYEVLRRANEHELARRRAGGTELLEHERGALELRKLLSRLLGEDFPLEIQDGRLQIGPHQPYTQSLSAGQQILFQFGCLLHAQRKNLSDSIVLLDEPENHLHPAVLIEVIAALQSISSLAQVWIATHSVPLVAHLVRKNADCLWYVNDGRVKRAGRTPELVLESLLGGQDGSADLNALTHLPYAYAATRFLSECLFPPAVVGPDVKDPQTIQIRDELWKIAKIVDGVRPPFRVLDFGAGKGRLLATLKDGMLDEQPWLEYFALDIDESDKAECLREMSSVYSDVPAEELEGRWFGSLETLNFRLNPGSFNAIVMCNVLHEIDPREWLDTFSKCASLLCDGGHVVLVEDYGIPVGERAHDYGFLLLDEPELSRLFLIDEEDRKAGRFLRQSSTEPRYVDRLVAHLIDKSCLLRATKRTQFQAIKSLRSRMAVEVRNMLKAPSNRGDKGRMYARSTQLFANTELWLEDHRGFFGES